MLSFFALVAVLTSAPEPVALASVGFQGPVAKKELLDSLANTLALRMTQTGLVRVTTPGDVAAVLGAERQRQLLGCSDSGCVAELAGALGAKGLITGELAVVGDVLQISVKVLDASSGRPLVQALERHGEEAALLSAIDRIAITAAEEVARHFGVPTARPAASPLRLSLFIAGGVFAVAGGVLLGLSKADEVALRDGRVDTLMLATARRDEGALKQGLGLGLIGGAVLAGAAGLVWTLVDASSGSIAIVPGPGGLAIVGSFE